MDIEAVDKMIRTAFNERKMPADLSGDALINQYLQGSLDTRQQSLIDGDAAEGIMHFLKNKSWSDVDPLQLRWLILYINLEAVAYYLPSILIFNIHNEWQIDAIGIYVSRSFTPLAAECYGLISLMTLQERRAVCEYLKAAKVDSARDVAIWEMAVSTG